MAVVKVYDQDKKEQGELTLTPEVFEVAVRPEILHLVVRAQLAAKRAGTHSTKTRAMVSGGGVKPWRQKGTGRARAGSNRSPVWRGGAILFGPQPRKYDFKVNKKIRKLALRMALSSRLAGETCSWSRALTCPKRRPRCSPTSQAIWAFPRLSSSLPKLSAILCSPPGTCPASP